MKLTSNASATVVTLVDPAVGADYQPAPAERVSLQLVKYQVQAGYEYAYALAGQEQEQQVEARIIQTTDLVARSLWLQLAGLIKNPAEQPFNVVFNDGAANPSFDGLWWVTQAVPDFKCGFKGHIPLSLTMLRKQ